MTIRNKSAYIAFLFTMVTASIMLLLYSAFTRGKSGFDPVWFALAFLIISPAIVFVFMTTWFSRN